tara:strand:+ start:1154 stop:1801 length:648 start_codon:yes stop_codon:yes gene_type:complete
MVLDIDKIHLLYEDMIDIKIKYEDVCDCNNKIFIPDNNNYYLVCNKCGTVKDTIRHNIMTYEEKQSLRYTPKRYYKRSAYLRTKINNIIKSKKPVLPDEHIKKIKKKIKKINMTSLIKYMKKHKLKKYDPVKSIFLIKNIKPINLCSFDFDKLIHDFNKKEKIYRDNNYNRFNYNFVLLKIFEEWDRPDMAVCFKLLQDDDIYIKHQTIYDKIFN